MPPFAEEDGSIVVPLMARTGRAMGYIHCADKASGPFDDDDRAVLTQMAQMASIALENSRLYNEIRTSDARKDEFLATLAHELRNPLAPISNSLQVLRADTDQARVTDSRAVIERQVAQLVHLVDDLLDVSRVSRGKLELRRRRVLLSDVLRAAVETSQPAIDAYQHTLRIRQPDDPVWLDADLTRLAQVFSNLLNNSAKYMEPGGRSSSRPARRRRASSLRSATPASGLRPRCCRTSSTCSCRPIVRSSARTAASGSA